MGAGMGWKVCAWNRQSKARLLFSKLTFSSSYSFIGRDNGQNLWHFDYNLTKPPSWSSNTRSPLGWVGEQHNDLKKPINQSISPIPLNGELESNMQQNVNSNETLRSLLERLSLSSYINLFQVCSLVIWRHWNIWRHVNLFAIILLFIPCHHGKIRADRHGIDNCVKMTFIFNTPLFFTQSAVRREII